MMKNLHRFTACAAIAAITSPAFGQAWTTGPRTVSYPGGALGTYPGIIGDGSTAQGGTPPAEASEPADIASGFTVANWIAADVSRLTCVGSQCKFRFTCNVSGQGHFDPILGKGIANFGHKHTFIGNIVFSKDSDYASLRAAANSTCSGGPVNRSLYWEPSVEKTLSNGAKATIKPDSAAFYYTIDHVDVGKYYRLLNGIQFIGGKWPADLNDAVRKAEVPAGFAWIMDGFEGGGMGWYCVGATGNPKKWLRNANGSDPWGGTCTAGNYIYAQIAAPECWDGENPQAPDGRSHLRYKIRHVNSGQPVCPDGWWRIPAIEAKINFGHNGPADYMSWTCSSDMGSALPCQSMHFDYIQAWDPTKLDTLQVNCLGIKIGGTAGNPGACDSGTISATERLKGGANGEASPDASLPNPIVDLNVRYRGQPNSVRYFPALPGTPIPGTITH